MLCHLHIQNYVLIDQLDIDFESGFTVITGETGAGKSILLGAIGLLLGQRADARSITAGQRRCVIEAEFTSDSSPVSDFLQAGGFDSDEPVCLVRRELMATGKSRAFINDTPATVAQLKELGDLLIDIHSQHQNLLLVKEDFQLSVLDIVARDSALLQSYQTTYKQYKATERELRDEEQTWQSERKEEDYMRFQSQQLDDAFLHPGELEDLEAKQRTLEHAEEIQSQLFQVSDTLQAEETGVLSSLRSAVRRLEGIAALYPKAEPLAQRLESCHIEIKDISDEIETSLETVDSNPQTLQQINDRLSLIYDLLQKHHVSTVEALIQLRARLQQRLSAMGDREERIKKLRKSLSDLEVELRNISTRLSLSRSEAKEALESQMCALLQTLGMPGIQFRVDIRQTEQLGPCGTDNVQFSFSANAGTSLQPISQVASGGEIARVMLALKAILSAATQLPTIVFDEIDTGVSGHIAESMARTMRQMSQGESRQVISITHLPQIAALGSHHFRVYKQENASGAAASRIVSLSHAERIEELAHMLSGSAVSQAAIDNAKELLSHSQK